MSNRMDLIKYTNEVRAHTRAGRLKQAQQSLTLATQAYKREHAAIMKEYNQKLEGLVVDMEKVNAAAKRLLEAAREDKDG